MTSLMTSENDTRGRGVNEGELGKNREPRKEAKKSEKTQ